MSIMIWGHRGYQHHRQPEKYKGYAYQNSMKAFEHALEFTMGLETDVIQSKDHTVYLTHDTLFIDKVNYELKIHLDEPSQKILGERFIFDLPDTEASRLVLKDGQKLATLAELLDVMPHYPGRIINLELKGPNTLDTALAVIDKAIKQKLITADQIVLSSFNLPELASLRQQEGDRFKIGALFSMKTQTKSRLFPDWPNAPQEAYYTPFDPQALLPSDLVRSIAPDYFHLERNSVGLDDIALIDKYYPEAKVSLWCIGEHHPDDKQDDYIGIIKKLAPTGKIYAVMTDFPQARQAQCIAQGLDVITPSSPARKQA